MVVSVTPVSASECCLEGGHADQASGQDKANRFHGVLAIDATVISGL